MIRILYVLAFIGCLAGGVALWFSISVPGESGGAPIAIALAVIPYCAARAMQEMMRP